VIAVQERLKARHVDLSDNRQPLYQTAHDRDQGPPHEDAEYERRGDERPAAQAPQHQAGGHGQQQDPAPSIDGAPPSVAREFIQSARPRGRGAALPLNHRGRWNVYDTK
jgi:hypothetical protein